MNVNDKAKQTVAHIEKLCSEVYRLTGKRVNHEQDERVHVVAGEVFLDGSRVEGQDEASCNYFVGWARHHEANFLYQLAEARTAHDENSAWVAGDFSR